MPLPFDVAAMPSDHDDAAKDAAPWTFGIRELYRSLAARGR